MGIDWHSISEEQLKRWWDEYTKVREEFEVQALKCDRCGKLSDEKYGFNRLGGNFPFNPGTLTWARPNTRGYMVTVILSPMNTAGEVYGGVDLCKKCFYQVVESSVDTMLNFLQMHNAVSVEGVGI